MQHDAHQCTSSTMSAPAVQIYNLLLSDRLHQVSRQLQHSAIIGDAAIFYRKMYEAQVRFINDCEATQLWYRVFELDDQFNVFKVRPQSLPAPPHRFRHAMSTIL